MPSPKIMTCFLLFTLMTGCATQSAYKAAKGDGSGYREIALAENHYQVQFKVYGNARAAAKKYALRRSSELTIREGYDWFIVEENITRTKNVTEPLASTTMPQLRRRCGLLTCQPAAPLPHEPLHDSETVTLTILKIRMGRGVRPEQESYDAREVWASE